VPRAVELRLREALQEYVQAYSGDAGHMRSAQPARQRQLVEQANAMLGGLGTGAQGEQAPSPGRRAAVAAGLNPETTHKPGLTPGQRAAQRAQRPSTPGEAFERLGQTGPPSPVSSGS
jgi:hypothetical protein